MGDVQPGESHDAGRLDEPGQSLDPAARAVQVDELVVHANTVVPRLLLLQCRGERALNARADQPEEHFPHCLRSLACSAATVPEPTISECFAITGFIASRNLASSAADSSVTCMPFFFRFSSAVVAASRETWR